MICKVFEHRDGALLVTDQGEVWSFRIGHDDLPVVQREGNVRVDNVTMEVIVAAAERIADVNHGYY